ncbi:Fur family peroxide stress response transcriptional regulator [Priestia megaterium]|uniref:Fur family transcriptional regulator n=1 Tax=Priestia megaterium TaxID=1404 RepID=UPI00203CBC23|nr:Fur family transcriptional regulator [Priestia megaterium]MCM3181310.1 transcriptional repressor [Priestia megaterium]
MELEEVVNNLKERGIKITAQRRGILKYLIQNANYHPTATEIYQSLDDKYSNISVATIYNNLHLFKKTGIVRELTFGDSSSRFELVTKLHYHVICLDCGKIQDFYYSNLEKIEKATLQWTGFKISHHYVEFYGYCRECIIKRNHLEINVKN